MTERKLKCFFLRGKNANHPHFRIREEASQLKFNSSKFLSDNVTPPSSGEETC